MRSFILNYNVNMRCTQALSDYVPRGLQMIAGLQPLYLIGVAV